MNPSIHFGESYMNGSLVVEEGRIHDFLKLIFANTEVDIDHWVMKLSKVVRAISNKLTTSNYISKSKRNVAHHYDLSDKLYELFLDPDRQYSCAYFNSPNDTLEQAQINKKELISKKLLLEENQSVLDIGCGWGGMAAHIYKKSNANVVGVTLSEEQIAYAKQRKIREKLEKVEYRLQDYRNVNEKYDRIVSVGMFEHVGIKYFKEYLKKTYDLLKDSGVFLLHTIGQRGVPTATSPWIRKYIFPGGYIPSLSDIIHETEKLNINITDIEILRLHYAHTLTHWYKNVQKNKDQIIKMFDERFYRMWEFYLLASKYSFVNMGNVVFQIQIAKNINNLPLTRNYMYN